MSSLSSGAAAARSSEPGNKESAAEEIARRVKDGVGVAVAAAVEVVDPGTLERSAGKFRRVVDRRVPA
jgi:phenylacetate-CoA ligase